MLFALRDRLRRIKVTAAAGLELKWSVVLVRCKEGKCYLSTFKGCVKRWSTTFQKCPNVLGCWKKTSLKTYFFPPLCFKLYTFFFFFERFCHWSLDSAWGQFFTMPRREIPGQNVQLRESLRNVQLHAPMCSCTYSHTRVWGVAVKIFA